LAAAHIVPFLFEKIESESALVKSSWSYRVGSFVTVIPRGARRILKGRNKERAL
jgi:hypothetical protein